MVGDFEIETWIYVSVKLWGQRFGGSAVPSSGDAKDMCVIKAKTGLERPLGKVWGGLESSRAGWAAIKFLAWRCYR